MRNRIRVSKGLLRNLYWQLAQKNIASCDSKLRCRPFDTRILIGNSLEFPITQIYLNLRYVFYIIIWNEINI